MAADVPRVKYPYGPQTRGTSAAATERWLLPALVFVVGAASLGAEIAAARLLAPYFGASTIVWANTIGVVLVALSVGYWFGGRFADRHPHLRGLCLLVLVASLLIAAVPFAARPFLGFSVDAFDTVSVGGFAGSLFGVLVLVAVPVTLLGAASPWAVRLAVGDPARAGEVVGRLYAISTAGSLFGTMIAALLLIPLLGTQRTFLVFALALAMVGAIGLGWRFIAVPLALALVISAPVGTIKAADTGRVLYEAETTHQYARVVERPDGSRVLELNEGQAVHSLYTPGSYLTDDYWDGHLYLPFAARRSPPARIAILGNAGGTVARAFGHFFPATAVDAVEIDAELTDLGRRFLDLRNPRMRVFAEDARPWLERMPGGYDAIMVDAYRQPYIPFYLATREFFELVRKRLAPGGIAIVNVGHPEGSDELERVLGRTMAAVFPRVLRDPIETTNTLLAASGGPLTAARLGRNLDALPPALRAPARLAAEDLGPRLAGGEVYTDDRAPVEWLVDSSLLEYANDE
ncbi:MAG TPA: fused MFS/spermidine synthase [Solirubrobacterales bacterium]|nr:fused MFS/spermidine synthase [Solirubrobacterales bacterium]